MISQNPCAGVRPTTVAQTGTDCSSNLLKPHLKVGNELAGVFAKGAMVGDIATGLHEQQVIKGFKDVDAGLVNGAHHSAACVYSVTHTPHDNGCCPGIQSCTVLHTSLRNTR